MKSILSKQPAAEPVPEYRLRAPFLHSWEISTYRTLCEVFDANNTVLAKVSLAELVDIPRPDRRYLAHWRRVQRRTLDFVICSTATLKPVLAIKMETELESTRRRTKGSDIVKQVLEDTGLPLLHLKAQKEYDVKHLARTINTILQESLENKPTRDSEPDELASRSSDELPASTGQLANVWTVAKEQYKKLRSSS